MSMDHHAHNQLVDTITREWLRLKNPTLRFSRSKKYREDRKGLARLLDDYAQALSRQPLARCPFCNELAQITISPRPLA